MRISYLVVVLLYCMIGWGISSCSSTSSSTKTKRYFPIPIDKDISSFVGKKVWFDGKITNLVYQHTGKATTAEEKSLYIEYSTGNITVAYYKKDLPIPTDKLQHKFYGFVEKLAVTGKGDSEPHTEYFLTLEKVE